MNFVCSRFVENLLVRMRRRSHSDRTDKPPAPLQPRDVKVFKVGPRVRAGEQLRSVGAGEKRLALFFMRSGGAWLPSICAGASIRIYALDGPTRRDVPSPVVEPICKPFINQMAVLPLLSRQRMSLLPSPL
jgi:hypothetical protein